MAADLRIRWHLELVDRASSKLLREDRAIRSSLQQTERAEKQLARAAHQSGQQRTRAHSTTATAISRESRAAQTASSATSRLASTSQRSASASRAAAGGLRTQGQAATVAGVSTRELNTAQARALQLTGQVASRSRQVSQAYRAQATAAREAGAAEATAARRVARGSGRGGAAAAGFGLGRGGGGGTALAGGAALAAGGGIRLFAGFEEQMDRVAAVSQASRREMEAMSKQAIQLGADTRFSAREAASGMYELSTAGFRSNEVMRAIPGTLALAAASGTELADAAEIQASALRGFGLDARDAGRVADVLTSTVNASAVEMYDLGESLKYIAPVARASGQSMETMLAAVGLMGNVGIKGSQAGTTLRTAMVRLTAPTEKSAGALEDLGIKAEELRGPRGLLPLPQIMEKIARGAQGVDKGTRNAALAAIFGREALSGMVALVEQGPQALNKQIVALKASEGQAKRTADVMRDNVAGAWDEFTGSVETAAISISRSSGPALKDSLRGATTAVNDLALGVTGGKGGGWAADFGRDMRGAAGAAGDFARELRPAGSFVTNVLGPLAGGAGQAALGSLKLLAGAATLTARGLGAIGDAAEDHPGVIRGIGVGLTVIAATSPRIMGLVGGMGRLGRAATLVLAPVRLVASAITAVAAGRGLTAGVGVLTRLRMAWRGVGVEATAAGRAQAVAAAGGAGGARGARGNRNLATAGTIWGARGAGARGAIGAGARALPAVGGAILRAVGPQALGIALVSGIIGGVTSQRGDFEGRFQDFLSGATLGIIPRAGKSFEQKLREEYTRSINAGLRSAGDAARRGQGVRTLEQVLQSPRRVPTQRDELFRSPRSFTGDFQEQARALEKVTQRQREYIANWVRSKGVQIESSTGIKGVEANVKALTSDFGKFNATLDDYGDKEAGLEFRRISDEAKGLRGAIAPVLREIPKLARALGGRADLRGLKEMRDLLAATGREGAKTRREVDAAMRVARGSTFQAQTRNLQRGSAISIAEVRRTVTQANRDLAARGVKPGSADFAARQEQLTSAAVSNIKKLVRTGVITADQGEREIRRILRRAQTTAGSSLASATRNGVRGLDDVVKGWARGWGKVGRITDQNVEKIGDSLADMPSKARRESARSMVLMAQTMEDKGALPRGSADRLVFLLQSRFGDLGNIDEPVKDPLKEIDRLLTNLAPPAQQAAGVIAGLGSVLASAIPPGFLDTLKGITSQMGILGGLGGLGALGSAALDAFGGKRRGGRINRFAHGGRVPILAAGGEAYVEPGGAMGMIPGDPSSDSTLIMARPGASVVTGDGLARMAAGASLDDALATQLPHFAAGGRVRRGTYNSTSYGPPWGGINGQGVTATGVNLKRSPHLYGVAVDPRWIALGQAPYIWPNPFGYSGRFRAFDTGGAIKGNRVDFYDWRGRKKQLGWGRRRVRVDGQRITRRPGESGAQFSSPTGRGSTPRERILRKSGQRRGLLDDAWSTGFGEGQGGLTTSWIRRRGNPILSDLRDALERDSDTTDAASRYRRPESAGSSGSSGGPGEASRTAAVRKLAAHTPPAGRPVSLAAGSLAYAATRRLGGLRIVSGNRGAGNRTRSGNISNHAAGNAVDLGPVYGARNLRIGGWMRKHFPTSLRRVTEGIFDRDHDPNPPDHADHVHAGGKGGIIRRALWPERLKLRRGGRIGRRGRLARFQGGGQVPNVVQSWQQGRLPGVGLDIERALSGAMSMRGGTLEKFDDVIRGAIDSRLDNLRTVLLGRIHRGGPERVVQRYQALLDTIDFELGRRVGLLIDRVQQRSRRAERGANQQDRYFRTINVDPESSSGLTTQLQLLQSYGEQALRMNVADLERALERAEKGGDRDAVRQITEQLDDARDELDEALVKQIELRRQIIRAQAQERVDEAQFRTDWSSGLTGGMEAGQRLAGVLGSAAGGGLASTGLGYLDSIGVNARGLSRADTPEGMRQRSASIQANVIPALEQQRSAIQGQFAASWITGDVAGVRAAALAFEQNANDLANAVAEGAELLRDAALTAAQETVSTAGHRTNLSNLGLQRLELEQRLAGTHEGGGVARAAYIRANVIPALQAELAAIQAQRAEQERQGVSMADLQQTIEAEGTKSNEILQAQLDAQEQTAENTEPLKDMGGTLGFEYRSQRLNDLLIGA